MTKVYQCDRCKAIFEPRVLTKGEPYITHKGNGVGDVDLCPNCYDDLIQWLREFKEADDD